MKRYIPLFFTLLLLTTVVSPSQAQTQPFDQFVGSWTVKHSTFGTTEADVIYNSVAGGRGILSIWRQGEGDSFYEAQALWGYDVKTEEVRIFEVNTVGVAILHVGHFDESGSMKVEYRSADGLQVLQRRVFEWLDEKTQKMSAVFYTESDSVLHSVVMVRE
jgi:hypothetical protein